MTEKINLRVLEKEDLTFIHHLYNNAGVMAYWFEEAHYSMASLEKMFEQQADNRHVRNFILNKDQERLGFVQLMFIDYIHRKAEFTIMIDPSCQGNGYANIATKLAVDYAFSILNLHKLYLYVDEVNEKAIHIYKKAGFQIEAVLEDEFFVNGKYHHAVLMRMFQEEYFQQLTNH